MGRFDPAFPVTKLRPAAYNPRAIDDESRLALQASIARLGFAKPIIVMADGLTIRREFNIAWPSGASVGRGDEVADAWGKAYLLG